MAVGYGKGWDPASFYKDDAIAGSYDEQRFRSLAGRVYNHLEKRLIRRAFADVPRASTVVDVPCGTGRLAEVLLEEGFTVVGLDISKSMLGVAPVRNSGASIAFDGNSRMLKPSASPDYSSKPRFARGS